jgi:choline dehydrogenase-like flavoprotein
MEANITDACRGSGYCNIGCGFAARHAALDVLLPRAQQTGDLDVLAEFAVERVERRGRRATGVTGRHRGGARVTLEAETIIVAAGPVGSSGLLLRSGLGGDAVGRGLHFNINSPLTAEFATHVDAFAGIQMSHAYVPPGDPPPYLVETWFNPPATQALATPGWFGRHWAQMHCFRNLACAGVIAGTTVAGRITESRGGPEIHYTPAPEDRDRVLEGLRTAGRIWLAAGAARVMPATFGFREYASEQALERLPADIRGSADLLLTSAHPQGGNAIGTVVGPDFRVEGTDALFLCDASAFPTSVHVNPQLTVMGLAELAARTLIGAPAPPATPAPAPTAPV